MISKNKLLNTKKSLKTVNKILSTNKIKLPAEYHFEIGKFYFKNNQYKEAIKEFRTAIKLNPRKINYYLDLADVFIKTKAYKNALQLTNKAISIDPNIFFSYMQKGCIENLMGLHKQALTTFKSDILLNSDCAKEHAIIHRNIAFTYQELGDYKKAIYYFNQALKRGPKDNELWAGKGVSLGNLGRDKEALQCFNLSLKLNPRDLETIHNKIIALSTLNRINESSLLIKKSLRLFPNDAELIYLNGNIYSDKNPRKAIIFFKKALKIDPKHDRALTNIGSALCRLNKHKEELMYYKKSLSVNPNNLITLNNYGSELLKMNNPQGLKYINKALKIDPSFISSYIYKVFYYHEKKQYKKAIENVLRIIELNPKEDDAYYNLACLYALDKDKRNAFKALKKAIVINKHWKKKAVMEKDFFNIKNSLEFKKLIK